MLDTTVSIAMNIITWTGTARSDYMSAIELAKSGKFEEAINKTKEAEEHQKVAHESHFDLITREAREEDIIINLLLIHAEDQLMMTESIMVLTNEIIKIYEKFKELE